MTMTIEEREAALAARETKFREDRVRFELGQALGAAKCRGEALQDATAIMTGACVVEFGEDGRLSRLTLGGTDYESPADAAAAFLGARAYFVESEKATAPKPTAAPTQQLEAAFVRTTPAVPAPREKQTARTLQDILDNGYAGTAGDLLADGMSRPIK
jgi:hypothetical protein